MPVMHLCLAASERSILGGDPCALLRETLLSVGEARLAAGQILLAALELVLACFPLALAGREVALRLRKLVRARGDCRVALRELG